MTESTQIFNVAYDIHPFDESKPGPIHLAGIELESKYGLKAHSDGDVVLHAIVDCILGLLALPGKRDIGSLFPDNDPQWKNADSKIFLKEVLTLARAEDVQINHINVQIACLQPRLSPHYEAMVESLAVITGLQPVNINVQSMSNNGVGAEGRGEAICAMACITASKPV